MSVPLSILLPFDVPLMHVFGAGPNRAPRNVFQSQSALKGMLYLVYLFETMFHFLLVSMLYCPTGSNLVAISSLAGTGDWKSVALSADGTLMLAAAETIWMSSDGGINWENQKSKMNGVDVNWWRSVAMTPDGTTMVAVGTSTDCWLSTDSGATRAAQARAGLASQDFSAVVISQDGTKIVAAAGPGNLWISYDSGVGFASRPFNQDWYGLAMPADGTQVLACVKNGNVWMSFDGGNHFIEDSTIGTTKDWRAVASSQDGAVMAAVAYNDGIWLRTDLTGAGGWAWTQVPDPRSWTAISMSQDASTMFAAASPGSVFQSADSGASWSEDSTFGVKDWSSVAVLQDGTKALCAAFGGEVVVFATTTTTTKSITTTSRTNTVTSATTTNTFTTVTNSTTTSMTSSTSMTTSTTATVTSITSTSMSNSTTTSMTSSTSMTTSTTATVTSITSTSMSNSTTTSMTSSTSMATSTTAPMASITSTSISNSTTTSMTSSTSMSATDSQTTSATPITSTSAINSTTMTSTATRTKSMTTTKASGVQIQMALAELEKRKAGLAEDLLNSLQPSNSSGLLAQSEVRLEDGTILIAAAMSPPSDDSSVTFGYGNLSVEVPAATLQSLAAVTVAIIGAMPRNSTLFSLLNSSDGGLQSEILSLDLFANGRPVRDLMEPIQLTLPTAGEPVVCGYFDEESNQWSTAGVSRVSSSDGTLVCATSHLSIFGALLASIYAALACSNAAAIFSSEGLQNLVTRPSWMLELSAVLNWMMLFIAVILLAMARRADNTHREALSVVPVISSLKHRGHQSEQWEFMDWLHALLPNPVEMVYSRMVKAHTGLTLKALRELYIDIRSGGTQSCTRRLNFSC